MTASPDIQHSPKARVARGADVSLAEHERLAVEMLAVEAGDVADVKDAMRKIIASAPDGANVAFLLSLAMSHSRKRTRSGEPRSLPSQEAGAPRSRQGSWPAGPNHRRPVSRWLAVVVPLLSVGAMCWWLGGLVLGIPVQGSATAGMAALSAFGISVGSLGIASIGVEHVILRRWRARGSMQLPVSGISPPGWYSDPLGQARSRWWNGFNWTGRIT
jgi:hypothetical protein